ncbi:MAG: radical SAM protein [Bacteroidales bacterium]|nr:radical SAM protein [Bacteroidales bacterium]
MILPRKVVDLISEKRQIKQKFTKKKKLSFEVSLVDHCNLNCQCCGAFAPLADEVYYDVGKLEKEFKRISELADGKIEFVRLLGGEPLLHPNLLEILDVAGKYFGKTQLELITNAILLDKQPPDFWVSCKKNNVKISITKYPINLPFKRIEKTGKKYGVAVRYFDGEKTLKTTVKFTMNTAGSADSTKNFKLCHAANNCTALDNGKIYPCSTVSRIKYFNKYFNTDLKVCDEDYIDIYKVNNLDEILEFLCKPVPFCRYCDIDKWERGIDWAVSNKNISEWI